MDFEETVLAHHPSITPEQFAAAIAAGDRFFAASSATPDYDDYHRVMLRHLGLDCATGTRRCGSGSSSRRTRSPPSSAAESRTPRMYHHASTALELAPAHCLFVDDDPSLVAAAIGLGYAGRAVCRDTATSDVPSVVSLVELLDVF